MTRATPAGFDALYWDQLCAELDTLAAEAHLGDLHVLRSKLGDLLVEATEPDVWELVKAAREPLCIDDAPPTPSPRRSLAAQRASAAVLKLDRLLLPEHVLTTISRHAQEAEPGYEVGGRLIIDKTTGHIRAYHRLINHATDPHRFRMHASWRPEPRTFSIICHSHGPKARPTPSKADLRVSRLRGPIAIWHAGRNALRAFDARADGYNEIAVEPLAAARSGYTVNFLTASVSDPNGRHVRGGYERVIRALRR